MLRATVVAACNGQKCGQDFSSCPNDRETELSGVITKLLASGRGKL